MPAGTCGAPPTDSRSATPETFEEPKPFGSFAPPPAFARLIRFAQRAPRNTVGKQLARAARALYLRGAPSPADITVDELRLRCWLADNTCERKFVFTPWRFDVRELEAIRAALPLDGVFVDIGANVGIYTLQSAMRLGAEGRVIAFEPYPPAFRRLKFNVEATCAGRAHWPRVTLLQEGVADAEARLDLCVDTGNLGGNSVAKGAARFSSAGSSQSVSIECRPLLAALAGLGIERIDALKIDIEGAEDLALCPFLEQAPASLLPIRIVLENSDGLWKRDLRAGLAAREYRELFRTRLNSVYERRAPGAA